MLALNIVERRHELLHCCVQFLHLCGKLGIDGGGLFVHGEAVVNKFLVGVGVLLVHDVELFVHGGAPCVEVF
jgi:hypothetical protein